VIRSDHRSEDSKACCHDGTWLRWYESLLVLISPQTHAITAAGLLIEVVSKPAAVTTSESIPTVCHGLRAVGQVCKLWSVDSNT